jgi:hypothetical protein
MIKLAMLWYETNPKNTLLQTITEAVAYYVKKYPSKPIDIVIVNPSDYDPDIEYPYRVEPWKYTQSKHIFVGTADDSILQQSDTR